MNMKRFGLSCIAVWLVYQVMTFVIHQVLLAETYGSLKSVWRAEAEMMSMLWIPMLTSVVWTILFCYIFTRGYENRGPMEGLRYGLVMGLFLAPINSYDWYMVLPITIGLAHAWFVATIVMAVVCGLVVGLVYRPAEA